MRGGVREWKSSLPRKAAAPLADSVASAKHLSFSMNALILLRFLFFQNRP
jgi:hypothetical protein